MKWRRYWPETLIAVLIVVLEGPQWSRDTAASAPVKPRYWTTQRKLESRERTRDLWYHGFDHYMDLAFPMDELTPLSCGGKGPDWDHPENIASNDVAGNFSLTLIDVLDTLVVLDDRPGFENAVRNVINWVSFDVNTKPQVFETTIRVLGGLLSGHIFASQTGGPFYLPWYHGELLSLAHDLGNRLLPAFSTPTGIPYARINLRHGVPKGETIETCTAGAGSLILEFATLSRLTGDARFEKVARKAFFALWNRKSNKGLVGNTINIRNGLWTTPEVTGIGAGVDSFYEYALKWYILSGEDEFLDVWHEAYAAIMRFSRDADGFWYRKVNIHTGDPAYSTVDSLSAFWPGLQVLGGDVQSAIRSHLAYWNIWRQHSAIPEVWDVTHKETTSWQYPLRPEFVESTWYLYRATRDPFYLDVGERILTDLIFRAKVGCGLTGIKDLRNNERDDRMESFVLSETLKYLYLIFDEENPLHSDDSNYVFTTEGHILLLAQDHLKPMPPVRRKLHLTENYQCPAYKPVIHVYDDFEGETGLIQGIRSRSDFDYARSLVFLDPQPVDVNLWTPYGWCEAPKVDPYSYDFVLSQNGLVVPEDLSPSLLKLAIVPDGFVVHNVSGIRAHIVKRLDGRGYDITKLGHYKVRKGQTVFINDSTLSLTLSGKDIADERGQLIRREPEVNFRFFLETTDPVFQARLGLQQDTIEALITGYTALFGGDLSAQSNTPLRFGYGKGLRVVYDQANTLGCVSYDQVHKDAVILVDRGNCTFLQKLVHARSAGAAGVVVMSSLEEGVNPTADTADLISVGNIDDVALAVVTRKDGDLILDMLYFAEEHSIGPMMVALDSKGHTSSTTGSSKEEIPHSNKLLYLNGHPLQNTKLMV